MRFVELLYDFKKIIYIYAVSNFFCVRVCFLIIEKYAAITCKLQVKHIFFEIICKQFENNLLLVIPFLYMTAIFFFMLSIKTETKNKTIDLYIDILVISFINILVNILLYENANFCKGINQLMVITLALCRTFLLICICNAVQFLNIRLSALCFLLLQRFIKAKGKNYCVDIL